MPKTIEFFFDLSSPWTYLAFHNIPSIATKTNATIVWRPFLVGGVHNQVNQRYVESRAKDLSSPKWQQLIRSMADWAALSNLQLNIPAKYFPLRSVHAMRFCCALEEEPVKLLQFATNCFDAYYVGQLNLDDPEVLVTIANNSNLDGEHLRRLSREQFIKDKLRANTEEATLRGAFGSPSIFVPFGDGERLYFGNDQLPLVEWAIQQP